MKFGFLLTIVKGSVPATPVGSGIGGVGVGVGTTVGVALGATVGEVVGLGEPVGVAVGAPEPVGLGVGVPLPVGRATGGTLTPALLEQAAKALIDASDAKNPRLVFGSFMPHLVQKNTVRLSAIALRKLAFGALYGLRHAPHAIVPRLESHPASVLCRRPTALLTSTPTFTTPSCSQVRMARNSPKAG